MNDADYDASKCAACDKEGGNSLKSWTACKLVKYCNTACQKAHGPHHKKECRKHTDELFDEALFKSEQALEMHIRGGELACGNGYKNAGDAYHIGRGVRIDNKKAMQYYVLAPIKGDVHARHNIACMEGIAGNNKWAMKHFTIAARAGFKLSLDGLKQYYWCGHLAKDEYEKILCANQKSKDEMKSEMRAVAIRMAITNELWNT